MDPVAARLDEWKRVVDHMKRLFAIVCGLALTLGCINAYTCFNRAETDVVGILQFAILLISVVPIFHGAERSLDLKYLRPESPGGRPFWVIVDFWLLLASALFLVVIAQCVPDYRLATPPDAAVLRERFLNFLGAFFLFDVAVLFQGALRAHVRKPPAPEAILIGAHVAWMIGNAVMAAACFFGRACLDQGGEATGLFLAIVALALLRTVWDYGWGQRFLFPAPP